MSALDTAAAFVERLAGDRRVLVGIAGAPGAGPGAGGAAGAGPSAGDGGAQGSRPAEGDVIDAEVVDDK